MNHLFTFSSVYLMLASTAAVMGYYFFRLDRKNLLNRLLLIIGACLALWALGFSVVIIAPNEEACVLWTKVSAVGYSAVYGVLLHFIVLLTDRDALARRPRFVCLIYLPVVFFLYTLVFSNDCTKQIYRFAFSPARGWVRLPHPPVYFDTLFRVYYASIVVLYFFLLLRWKHRNRGNAVIRRQSNILSGTFGTAFLLGGFTDMINGTLLDLPIPMMAPIFFLLPLTAIVYCIKQYHFLKPPPPKKDSYILDEKRRNTVFEVMSLSFMLGGSVFFWTLLFWFEIDRPVAAAIACAMLVAVGFALYHAQARNKPDARLELILVITSVVITPTVVAAFAPTGASSVWSLPVILIIGSLVFNSDYILIASALPAVFGQIYLIGAFPHVRVIADQQSYFARIGILLLVVVATYFVHQIYLQRIRENAEQTRARMLTSSVATDFSLADDENISSRMADLLATLYAYYEADLVLFNTFCPKLERLVGNHFYAPSGKEPNSLDLKRVDARWKSHLLNTSPAGSGAGDHADAHPGLAADHEYNRIKTLPWLFIPIYEGQEHVACFYIESSRSGVVWAPEHLMPIPILSRIVSDTLDNLAAESQVRYMAYYDSLTDLPNRQLFHNRTETAIEVARQNATNLGVVFLDLDSFKSINDTMGHEGGDQLIRAISQKLAASIRKGDMIARFGGDEFLFLLTDVDSIEEIAAIAGAILALFEEPIFLQGQEIFITASAGISVFPTDGVDAATLIKHADIAMYNAKELGKNRFAFCTTAMKETVQYHVNLSNSLYRALERGELSVYYQPQIKLGNERIIGLEALLRWRHPEFGWISPAEFIPLAEQTGLIYPIGNWVLETACLQAVAWREMGFWPLRISVNLSVVQLRNLGLVNHIAEILERTGIDPSSVELEITESTTTHEPSYIIHVLNNLKKLGVSIAIDDFGMEYSSLNRLKQLPVDKLKMDIQFVRGIEKSAKDQAISLVIMNLAHNLELEVVAEGVENQAQLDFLKEHMCGEVQGFYYYRPMPPAEVEEILAGHFACPDAFQTEPAAAPAATPQNTPQPTQSISVKASTAAPSL